ncbi:hypothetical protein EOM86_12255 [Candidatus Nomurabacteria bacterium]|nr:hypothetical protein [Candidatus Nomurabacteria bacterium]
MKKNKFEIFVSRAHFESVYGDVKLRDDKKLRGQAADLLEKYGEDFLTPKGNLRHGMNNHWETSSFWAEDGNKRVAVIVPDTHKKEVYCVVLPNEGNLLATCGFAIDMDNDEILEENAGEDGITLDWDKLSEDASVIESRMLKWLDYRYGTARDEGHNSNDELVGTLFVYRNVDEINKVIEHGEPMRQSSGSWIEPDNLWEGLHYPGLWNDITVEFFNLVMEGENEES